jgi:hypothetical protein
MQVTSVLLRSQNFRYQSATESLPVASRFPLSQTPHSLCCVRILGNSPTKSLGAKRESFSGVYGSKKKASIFRFLAFLSLENGMAIAGHTHQQVRLLSCFPARNRSKKPELLSHIRLLQLEFGSSGNLEISRVAHSQIQKLCNALSKLITKQMKRRARMHTSSRIGAFLVNLCPYEDGQTIETFVVNVLIFDHNKKDKKTRNFFGCRGSAEERPSAIAVEGPSRLGSDI